METNKIISQNKINKVSKKNSFFNNIYKNSLTVLSCAIGLIILVAIVFIFYSGIHAITSENIPLDQWLFTNKFNPGSEFAAGFVMIINTLWMSFLALLIAVPISIGTALIITRTLKGSSSTIFYSIVAILAAIPSVIYGAFGYYVIDSFSTQVLGFHNASLFTVIIMISFMITPTITLMTIASIRLTDKKMEDSSYALGATKTQTSFYITLRAARNGIITGIIFALGRCIAETTAISMVGSPLLTNDAFTIMWWQQSLFMGPAILTINSLEQAPSYNMVGVITMLLVLTTLSVFAIMKTYEYKSNVSKIMKKQNKLFSEEKRVIEKYDKFGIEELTSKEQDILIKYHKTIEKVKLEIDNSNTPEENNKYLLKRSTLSSTKNYENHKKRVSLFHKLFIYIASFIGVILLFGIIVYLFNGGFKWFTWETLTKRGVETYYYDDGTSTTIIGMAIPLLGTYINMILSLIIALPIGVALGIYLSTYLRKDNIFGQFVSYVFQILTAIPGIAWATFCSVLFIGTGFYENYLGFVPIIFLVILILPSIIKSVEESAERINTNLKDGSFALGSTVANSTRRIYIKEVLPSIISGALLAMSIAVAESTIFVYIIPNPNSVYSLDDWIKEGGYTLSTLIFNLNNMSDAVYPDASEQIKAAGILLMIIILAISFTSSLINKKRYAESLVMGLAILLFPISIYVNNGSILLVILTIVLALIAITIVPMIKRILRTRNENILKAKRL